MPYKNDLNAHVIWGDGVQDSQRDCCICDSVTCVNPVHKDRYKTLSDALAKKWDENNPVV